MQWKFRVPKLLFPVWWQLLWILTGHAHRGHLHSLDVVSCNCGGLDHAYGFVR